MKVKNLWRLAAPIIIGLHLTGCQRKPEIPANIEGTRVESTGPAVYRVRLTAKRAEQLGIETAPVREEKMSGVLRKVIPAAAIIRDQKGDSWIFKSPDSLVFIQDRISVDRLDGELAILSSGPPVGTSVVTAGAAELFSDEFSRMREGIVGSDANAVDEGKKSAGTATMLENGNLKVVHKAAGASGLSASIIIEYKPQDEEYQKILEQVGGLKVGETKNVPPPR
ncbi:MAG: hypothetical protein ACREOO_20845 [bacterium]